MSIQQKILKKKLLPVTECGRIIKIKKKTSIHLLQLLLLSQWECVMTHPQQPIVITVSPVTDTLGPTILHRTVSIYTERCAPVQCKRHVLFYDVFSDMKCGSWSGSVQEKDYTQLALFLSSGKKGRKNYRSSVYIDGIPCLVLLDSRCSCPVVSTKLCLTWSKFTK